MEQEITLQELIALMNDTEGEFIFHVQIGEEADVDGRTPEISQE